MPERAYEAAVSAVTILLLTLPIPVDGVVIHIGSAEGRPGDTVSIEVTVDTEGEEITGIQNDIAFEPQAPIAADDLGRPVCRVAPFLFIMFSTFAFQPPGCERDLDCEVVRALVLELSNTGLNIPNGLVYTCDVAISPDAPFGEYALVISNTFTSDLNGSSLPTTGTDGVVVVVPCTGDCDNDGQVTVDELILGLVIAQEQEAIDACQAIDSNGDRRASIDEVVGSLNNLLTGCVVTASALSP